MPSTERFENRNESEKILTSPLPKLTQETHRQEHHDLENEGGGQCPYCGKQVAAEKR